MYEGSRQNIVTMLYIKDLALVDPDDNTLLKTLCQFYQNPCYFVFEDTTLDVLFKQFKEGGLRFLSLIPGANFFFFTRFVPPEFSLAEHTPSAYFFPEVFQVDSFILVFYKPNEHRGCLPYRSYRKKSNTIAESRIRKYSGRSDKSNRPRKISQTVAANRPVFF